MRLLFITSTRVGDAVLSTGLLDHLVRSHPGVAVTIACGRPAAALFRTVPNLQGIIVLEKKALSLHWLELWRRCVGRWWDMLVDLRNNPMTFLLAAGRRLRVNGPDNTVHRVVRLARIAGLQDNPPAPRLWLGETEKRAAEHWIPPGGPVLAVGPTANWIAKTWRAERFAELVSRLTGPGGMLPGARIAIFAHADERAAAAPLLNSIPPERRIDLIGRIDLLEVYACLKRTTFYVGNDSGLMHLAAAAGVPTLGLFGPSREELYAPWGSLTAVVRPPVAYEELFPEGFDHRRTGTLMDGLSVDRVEQAAHDLWCRVEEAT